MRIHLSADHATVFTSGERGIAEVLDTRTGAVLWNAEDRFLRAAEGRDAVFQDGDEQLESVEARSGRLPWKRRAPAVLRAHPGVPTNVGVDASSMVISATCDDG
jgi:hypothetical protein